MNDHVAAIIVAAGRSTRYGADKILDDLAGAPALARALAAFVQCGAIDQIVVVTRADLKDDVQALVDNLVTDIPIEVVQGGERRQDSVAAGLSVLVGGEIVVVHDGARPMVTPSVIQSTIDAVREGADGALAAVPVSDTL
ncbi:MAG: 2-C-methyl-D-erythritol 4-phosphate cytidylyltransferase, partial [Chloroflexota bacterium]|nr:2-C-methyl-D-erythritol 4-phosphate cytidylyltransferase [Chloroflexota bacterium]